MADTAEAAPVALFKKRGKGKANIRKRPATPPPADSDSDDYSTSEDDSGQRVKRRKKTATVTASSNGAPGTAQKDLTATVYKADRNVPITDTNDATKQTNWYDENSKDALSAKNLLGSTRSIKDAKGEGSYRGLANQNKFIERNPDAPSRTVGPIKAPTNIRTITVTDYAPDVCKDYKTTGFCGFGDNCKYLHAREAYAAGWQLDKEWESVSKGKANLGGTVVASADRSGKAAGEEVDDEDAKLLQEIPFKCIICKEDYREPIVTRCGHYFCEGCALKRYRKDPTCAACSAGTNGVFNAAKRLRGLLEKKKKREERLKKAEEEEGEKEE